METTKALIVDDDIAWQKIISQLLRKHFDQFEIDTAKYALEGLKKIIEWKPDLVFLDYEMPNGTGQELLNVIQDRQFSYIYVSGHSDIMSRTNTNDCLLKPINSTMFCSMVKKKLLEIWTKKSKYLNNTRKLNEIPVDSIIKVEANGSYSTIFINTNKKFIISKSIGIIQKELPANIFIRPHRSHLINKNYITEINMSGKPFITLNCGTKVPISKERKSKLIEEYSLLTL